MKGIVFKELISMMESTFGDDLTEDILGDLSLKSEGAYTSVGYYDHSEILDIVTSLSEKTGVESSKLVKTFGRHLLDTFHKIHPEYFNKKDALDFMKSVDNYIHVEVKKLHPDAELPKLDFTENENGSMTLIYQSTKPFADLAEGLIERCIEVFEDDINLNITDRTSSTRREFILTPHG